MLKGTRSASREVVMEQMSREYGWTPTEIRQLTRHELEYYNKIIEARHTLTQK